MVQDMDFYLAYGSNLSVGQMLKRCPDAVYVGTAMIPGYRLLFKGSKSGSYLTIEKMRRRKVPVLVWKVSEEDEQNLDIYEGFPRFYRKERMKVELHSLADDAPLGKVDAFVYIMDEKRSLGIPSDGYYSICEEGYQRFGFDTKILEKAYLESAGTAKKTAGKGGWLWAGGVR